MAKYYGVVGYVDTVETAPGVWQEKVTEREYFGDLTRNIGKWERGNDLNDDINIQNDISIVADSFAYEHFHAIRYVTLMGSKWKVKSVEVSHPRLILSVGGIYNEQQT